MRATVVEQLVAQHPEGRVQRLGGAEQLLLALLPLAAERGARLLGERRRRLLGAAVGARRDRRARAACARASSPRASRRRISATCASRESGGSGLREQRVGDRLERAPARARHARRLQPEHEDVVELEALGRRAWPSPARRARLAGAGRLLLAQPGLGDRGDVAGELARRGLRRAPHVGGGQLAEAGEVDAAARRPRPGRRTAAGGAGRAARSAGARRGRGASCPAPPTAAR